MSPMQALMDATAKYGDDEQLSHFGSEMFRMYTEMGFPPDMFMAELNKKKLEAANEPLTLLEKVYITSVYQTEFLEHRRKAGIQEKNLPKLRRRNLAEIESLLKTGELGTY